VLRRKLEILKSKLFALFGVDGEIFTVMVLNGVVQIT
jgi:hypothetical protein